MRSSQPLSGPNVKRCREDEKLLNSVLKTGMRGYIIDTRHQNSLPAPKVNFKDGLAEQRYLVLIFLSTLVQEHGI